MKNGNSLTLTAQMEGVHYPIRIGRGILQEVAPFLSSCTQDKRVLIATDTFFHETAARRLASDLKAAGFRPTIHPIVGGKTNKNLEEMTRLLEIMEGQEFARDSSLITVGGGVIGDMAGFAAATFLRGINLVHVPTTVTSQIDSSIGGKVGVNFRKTINAIGTYYHPQAIFTDLAFLDSLPERDFVAGLGEIIKCAIICDPEFFSYLQEKQGQVLARDEETLLHLYQRAIEIKIQHVAGDSRDQNLRLRLNYGHTIGHAVELATTDEEEMYRHGEGVALGMLGASYIADQMFGRGGELFEQHQSILLRYGLPTVVDLKRSGLSRQEFVRRCLAFVGKDKKRLNMKVRFILPTQIGKTEISDQVPVSLVEEAVEMLCDEVIPAGR